MQRRRRQYFDLISRRDRPGHQHNAHDSSLANQFTFWCSVEHGREKARLEVLDLCAGVSKASDSYNCLRANAKDSTLAERQQWEARGCDVFAQLARHHLETSLGEFVQEFLMQQVNLPQVRLRWVFGYARAVLDCDAIVGVSDDPVSLDQLDRRHRVLGERVGCFGVDG